MGNIYLIYEEHFPQYVGNFWGNIYPKKGTAKTALQKRISPKTYFFITCCHLCPPSHTQQYYQQQKKTLFGNFHAYRTGKSPLQRSSPLNTPKMSPITTRKSIFLSRSSCYTFGDEYTIAVKILQIGLTKLNRHFILISHDLFFQQKNVFLPYLSQYFSSPPRLDPGTDGSLYLNPTSLIGMIELCG